MARLYSFFFKSLRRLILRIADPYCTMTVWNTTLWMPFSHLLPYYTRSGSEYDKLLGRVGHFIRASHARIIGVDIGANIGDTIVACSPADTDQFLALEPHPAYFDCLQRNLGAWSNIRRLQVVCGAKDNATTSFQIKTINGTAQIYHAKDSETAIASVRLDTLLQHYPEFQACNLLKIDTDGHDFDVIRGAKELIERAKPIVFFECDIFQNSNYVADIQEVFRVFAEAGYQDALIYDNSGYFFCRIDLKQPAFFVFSQFHKLITQRYYFDVLMLRESGNFLASELEYFTRLAPDSACQSAAKKAAELIKVGPV